MGRRLRELVANSNQAALRAQQELAVAHQVMAKADATLDDTRKTLAAMNLHVAEIKAAVLTTLATWNELGAEILDGGKGEIHAAAGALAEVKKFLAGEEATFPFYGKWILLEGDEPPAAA
jgi:hypothetical protein